MNLIIALALLAIIVVASALIWRRHKHHANRDKEAADLSQRADEEHEAYKAAQYAAPYKHKSPSELQVGDKLWHPEFGNVEIIGIVVYDEDKSWRWYEFYISTDSGSRQWFSAEKPEGLGDWEFVLWVGVKGNYKERPKTLTYEGCAFSRTEKDSNTRYRATGRHDLGQDTGTVDYAEYREQGGGNRLFAIERYNDGAWEACVGTRVPGAFLNSFSD